VGANELENSVSRRVAEEEPIKQFSISRGNPSYENEKRTKKRTEKSVTPTA